MKEEERNERWKQGRKVDMQEEKKRKEGSKERRKKVRIDGRTDGIQEGRTHNGMDTEYLMKRRDAETKEE